MDHKQIFFAGLIVAASGLASPPLALSFGLAYALAFPHPYPADGRRLARFLLQASVVGLGFGMNLRDVLRAGGRGFYFTALSISITLLAGLGLGYLFRVERTASFLISVGTAICGGSAIAAIGPIIGAGDDAMAVAFGTIFILNSIALLVFPTIGWALGLSQSQFGLWSALAIHDTSSVVGATAKYGAGALAVGTTVKLVRALWIVPVCLLTAAATRRRMRIQWPWFILLFCLAAALATYVPVLKPVYVTLNTLGRIGLLVTLYLIGAGLSRQTVVQVGARPLVQGIVLWAAVGGASLLLIRLAWIAI